MEQRNFYSVKEVREIVYNGNISNTTLHKLINTNKIPCIQLNKRRLIPASWVEEEIAKGHAKY